MSRIPFWSPLDAFTGAVNPWDVCTLTASAVPNQPTNTSLDAAFAQDAISGTYSFYRTIPALNGNVIALPGISRVSSLVKDIRLNILVAPGIDNAPIYYLGTNPGTFSLSFTTWMPSQWEAMQQVLEIIQVTPNKSQPIVTYSVNYPTVLARKIGPVIVNKITGPEPGDFDGGSMKVTFDCTEYSPPPKQPPVRPSAIGQAPNAVTGFPGSNPNSAPGAATAVGAIANPPSKSLKPAPPK